MSYFGTNEREEINSFGLFLSAAFVTTAEIKGKVKLKPLIFTKKNNQNRWDKNAQPMNLLVLKGEKINEQRMQWKRESIV